MNAVKELFQSSDREKLDQYLVDLISKELNGSRFKDEILSHLCLTDSQQNSLEHSKRLRGMLCILLANGMGVEIDDIIPYSGALELVHNASLIIDDIQDNSNVRCNKKALWQNVGKDSAINHAFVLRDVALQSLPTGDTKIEGVLQDFLSTARIMAEGQDMDINADKYWDKGFNSYKEIVSKKTASLLSLTCRTAAILGESTNISLYSEFGENLGFVHQLEDDLDDVNKLKEANTQIDAGSIVRFMLQSAQEINYESFLNSDPNDLVSIRDRWKRELTNSLTSIRILDELDDNSFKKINTISSALSNRNKILVEGCLEWNRMRA